MTEGGRHMKARDTQEGPSKSDSEIQRGFPEKQCLIWTLETLQTLAGGRMG